MVSPETGIGRLLGSFMAPVDPIDHQLKQLSTQGAGMARLAHACATLLVILFSAGSLVALGSDALTHILVEWQYSHTLDIPSTITVAVSTLMVLAMDCAMISAASMLRLLFSRRAPLQECLIHIAVMAIVAVLEAGTYAYMSFTFERPASTAAAALIVARALAAPLLAVYLSMRHVLPITSRDILGQVELSAGTGVLRDVTMVARDPSAPLQRKMQLYGSAAIMAPSDRHRLDGMIAVVMQETPAFQGPMIQPGEYQAPESPYTASHMGSSMSDRFTGPSGRVVQLAPSEAPYSATNEPPDRPPTGPGTPNVQPVRTTRRPTQAPGTIKLVPEQQPQRPAARARRRHPKESVEARVRAVYRPGMSVSELERASGVSRSSANRWRIVLERELASQQAAQ